MTLIAPKLKLMLAYQTAIEMGNYRLGNFFHKCHMIFEDKIYDYILISYIATQ